LVPEEIALEAVAVDFVPTATPALKQRKNARNEKFANDGSYASVEAQLHRLAMKCYARVQAMGLGMDFDDVLQEMNMTYVRAKATWNPEKGVRFSTYCQTACMNNFNQRIERQVKDRTEMGMISYDEALGDRPEDAGDDALEYLVGDVNAVDSAESQMEIVQEARARLARLTPGTQRLILAFLMDERDRGGEPGSKLRDLAAKVGLTGEDLQRTKREVHATFGVRWV
jgi:RNA polymerase sigma factor (sigma-70 family)